MFPLPWYARRVSGDRTAPDDLVRPVDALIRQRRWADALELLMTSAPSFAEAGAGGTWLALVDAIPRPALARAADQRVADGPVDEGALTPREAEVLVALTEPVSLAVVAARLFLSANTLKTHTRRIYRKLGVASRAQAIDVARRTGLV
jgi:DNA-binding NarL/FixJ family response regulator